MKIIPWISALIAGALGWLIGKAVGDGLLSAYRNTGDMVTAHDNIELTYVTPIVFSIIFAYGAYYLTKGNE